MIEGEEPSQVIEALRVIRLMAALLSAALAAFIIIVLVIRISGNPAPARDALGRFGEMLAEAGSALTTAVLGLAVAAVIVAYIPFVLWVFTWVAHDADSRGHVGALWAVIYIWPHLTAFWVAVLTLFLFFYGIPILVLAVGWIGLALYMASRRPGRLVRCKGCRNRKLEYALTCPHCGR